MWIAVCESEVDLDEVDDDVVFGVGYAELVARDVVELTESGYQKVRDAHAALTALLEETGSDDDDDEDDVDEEDE